MGTYATTTGLQVLMVGTKFDTATTSLCDKLITHAENEIDKYLSKRYDMDSSPFDTSTSIPPIVTSMCETLTEGYMHQRMSRGGKEAFKRGKELIDQVLDNLKRIAEYKADIIATDGSVVSESSSSSFKIKSTTQDYSNTFNEDDGTQWKVDQDKLDDISTERDD